MAKNRGPKPSIFLRFFRHFLYGQKVTKEPFKEGGDFDVPSLLKKPPSLETTKGKSLGSPLLDYLSLGCTMPRGSAYCVSAD